jgi:hypothetical protein
LAAVATMLRAGWTAEKIHAAFKRTDWLIGARHRDLLDEGLRRADEYIKRTIRKAERTAS